MNKENEIKCKGCNEVLVKIPSSTAICIQNGYIKCMRCGTKRVCNVIDCKEKETKGGGSFDW